MRKGSKWETEAKKILQKKYKTDLVFHMVNTEHIDFIVFPDYGDLLLVEAKQTKLNKYYTKENKKKRNQLKAYFTHAEKLREQGYSVWVCLFICFKQKKEDIIIFDILKNFEEVKTVYKV